MYGQCNIEARSYNDCCCGKAINITYSECVYSLRYTACNAHAPYCFLWPVRFYNTFPHYLIHGMILEKKNWAKTVCFGCLSETFLILRSMERVMINHIF